MGNYVVSARKYRPLSFNDVIGQDHIKTTLNNAISNKKLAQALLFCGPRGVGKTTCARIVARLVNRQDDAATNSLNIFELDAASNNSVDDIRNLTGQVRYPPQTGQYKVYIIDEVHMLSNAAFNAFLKTLEEPPAYAIFILATTEKHKVIPTILSRCQIFDFNRIQVVDISKQLRKVADLEGIEAEDNVLYLIAKKADGALRDALSLFDRMVAFSGTNTITLEDVLKNLHILDHDYYFKIVNSFLEKETAPSLLLLDDIIKKGFDGKHFVVGLSTHIRNLLVAQNTQTATLIEETERDRKKYIEQAGKLSANTLLAWLEITTQCERLYKESQNQRLILELGLMKMANINFSLPVKNNAPVEVKKKNTEVATQEVIPSKKTFTEKKDYTALRSDPAPDEPTTQQGYQKARVSPDLRLLKTSLTASKKETTTPLPSIIDAKNTVTSPTVLRKIWDEFAEQYKHKNIEHQILKRKIDFRDNEITIYLTNSLEESFLQKIKVSLMSYLRGHLGNGSITIRSHLNETETQRAPYTNKEKFDTLTKKYPMIGILKNRLQLDIEY